MPLLRAGVTLLPAICFSCAHFKGDALERCGKCGQAPLLPSDRAVSLALDCRVCGFHQPMLMAAIATGGRIQITDEDMFMLVSALQSPSDSNREKIIRRLISRMSPRHHAGSNEWSVNTSAFLSELQQRATRGSPANDSDVAAYIGPGIFFSAIIGMALLITDETRYVALFCILGTIWLIIAIAWIFRRG